MTVDLAAANSRYVMTVPQSLFERPARSRADHRGEERAGPRPAHSAIHRMPMWNPLGWLKTRSADRVRDFVAWERDTLSRSTGSTSGVEYTHTIGVAELYDYEWYFAVFSAKSAARRLPGHWVSKWVRTWCTYPRRGFDMWNTRYFVLPFFPGTGDDETPRLRLVPVPD